ncbi:MAG: DUF2127 domain-containing protein [Alphaproteobacteria bacterium]|nr:DUF2127 domain-containing protein [Alphaproteobacteria bacterium]MBV9063415.1 DUF2127 domain-containing protein [Alphaproteobacteria bacterium]
MPSRRTLMHRAYQVAIAIKGLDGAIEFLAGLFIALVGSRQVYHFAIWATAPEIARHPESHAAHAIRHGAYNFAHHSHRFAIIYLLTHGLLKIGLVVNLFLENMWIFPASVVVLLGFIAFMTAKLVAHWSPWLFAFALFDTLTLALVLNEWRVRLAQRK